MVLTALMRVSLWLKIVSSVFMIVLQHKTVEFRNKWMLDVLEGNASI